MLLAIASATYAAEPSVTTAGPFEIEKVAKKIGAGGFPNTSSNPFARTTVTVFRVKHRGRKVEVTDGKVTHGEFWEAKVLEGTPRPALLLAVSGVYLLTEEQGQARIDILAASTDDGAKWQWLDANEGQPGEERLVTIRDRSEEPRSERGGTLLSVNRRVVLDLATLKSYPVAVNSTENLQKLDQYYAGNEPVRALSPGRTQYVLAGNRQRGNMEYDYALVAVEYASGKMYAVPFDSTALRFESVVDVTPQWLASSFEWAREKDGTERLRMRKDFKPAPWVGRFVRFGGGMVDYRLKPTQMQMLGVLHAFIVNSFAGTAGTPSRPDDAKSKTLFVEGSALRVNYRDEDRTTSLYAEQGPGRPPTAGWALVEKIGQRFNEELQQGRHQELFSR